MVWANEILPELWDTYHSIICIIVRHIFDILNIHNSMLNPSPEIKFDFIMEYDAS